MCGIAGIYTKKKNIDFFIKTLLSGISKRGPDFQDFKIFNKNLALGHSRLSIIDLDERSNQPMLSKSKQSAISFNGEIYNFESLKKEFFKNHYFKTSGDTELLLEGVEKYGFTFLQKVRGFFSFCFYDINNNKIYLARDEYGKKPLYYYYLNDEFYFSSELHSLIKIIDSEKLNINQNGLGNYFWKGYFNDGNTIYENIKTLHPGFLLSFDIDRIDLKIEELSKDIVFNETDNVLNLDEIEKEIEDAINVRKVSDVKISYLLSGGLDSSLICKFASKYTNINTFYAKFNKKKIIFDKLSNDVSKLIKSDHNILDIDHLDLNQILKLNFDIFHEPFADYSSIPSYLIYKKISDNYKVTITGDGADELFGGYQDYKIFFLKNFFKFNFKSNIFLKLFNINSQYNFIPKKLIYLLSVFFLPESKIYNLMFNGGWNLHYRKKFMVSHIFKEYFNDDLEQKEELNFIKSGKNPLERSFNMYLNRLKCDFNVKVDRTSMYNSLEARSPFLDKKLFSKISKRNLKFSITGLNSKNELKQIARNNNLDFITKSKKEGFTMPLHRYLCEKKNRDFLYSLTSNNSIISNYFDVKKLKEIMSNDKKIIHNSFRIWILLVLNQWHIESKIN